MSADESEDSPFYSAYKYTCSYPGCDLEFKRKDRLDSHEFTHSHVKKFKCTEPNCAKSYINSSHLQRHKRTAHAKPDEIVQCSFESCGKFFDTEAKMKLHFRQIHLERMRDFECEICNEKFRRKTQLRQHMFTHTGSYRYTCEKCEKGFFLMSRLKRHEKSHQSRQCECCDATFDKWSSLMAHKQKEHLNSEHKCSVCNVEFHSKRDLKNHKKTHMSPDKRAVFQCTFENCPKYFLQRSNMLAHFKSKHENRRFVCSVEGCTSELSTKQKLHQHIKAIHSGECSKNLQKLPKQQKAERKDKGVQKTSTASKLFNIILPAEFEQAIIAGQGKSIHITYDRIDNGDDGNDDADVVDHSNQSPSLDAAQLNATNGNLAARIVGC